jgi:hypothetical protein
MAIYNFRAFEFTKTGGNLSNQRQADEFEMDAK